MWRRLLALLFLWFYRITGGLTIAAGLFVLVAQTGTFREWFRDFALELANDALLGRIEVSDIRLDIFRGIVLEYPRLTADNTTVMSAKSISIHYDLAALFERVAAINSIVLDEPQIKLIRNSDGVWNFSQIVAPSQDTTVSEPIKGTLLVRALEIRNGHLWVNDRTTSTAWSEQHFDPVHLELANINLALAARIGLGSDDVFAAVNALSFEQVNGPLDVQEMQLGVRATSKGLEVESLHLRLPNSEVFARISMDSINVFDGIDSTSLKAHPFKGHVNTNKFYGPDLHYFIRDIDLLGYYTLDVDAEFDGTQLTTRNVRLTAGDARVNGRVRINHIDGSAPLELDIEIFDSQARYADVRERVRTVEMPELPFLERAYLDHVKMYGHPDDSLWFEVRGHDRPGAVDGQMTLYLSTPTLGYQVDMEISGGDVGAFDDGKDLSSTINGRIMMVGSGVNLQELAGTTQIELNRSRLLGRPIKSLRAMIHGDGKGHIRVDTIYADVSHFQEGSLVSTDPMIDVDVPRQVFALNAAINVEDPDHPKYIGSISIEGVNFAQLFRDEALPHLVSAELDVNAEGIVLDSIRGSVSGMVNGLAMRDRALLPFEIEARSERSDFRRSFGLETSFGHVYVDGDFTPSALISALAKSTEVVTSSIEHRIRNIVQGSVSYTEPIFMEPFRAHIDIDLLEVSPLNLILPNAYISGQAQIDATVRASSNEIEVVFDSMYVADFSLTTDSLSLYADPTHFEGRVLVSDLSTNPLATEIEMRGVSDSLIRINNMLIRSPRIDIASEAAGRSTKISASTGLADMLFRVNATMTEESNKHTTVKFDTLDFALDLDRGLNWRLRDPSTVSLSQGAATFNNFTFLRIDGEEIRLDGTVSDNHLDGAKITIKNFPLRDIRRFANVEPDDPIALISGLVTRAEVHVSGTFNEPEISVDLSAENVAYNRTLIGSLSTKLQHKNRNVWGTTTITRVDSASSKNPLDLVVKSFPLDLAFAEVEDRLVPGEPIDVRLTAQSLSLAAIEPFLPAVERVRGNADAEMSIKGSFPDNVTLQGQANYNKARFLSSATNMAYVSSGTLHLEGSNLHLDSISLRNMSSDLNGGNAVGTGIVHFTGLAVDSIDLELTTSEESPGLKILNNASQARSPKVYGDLIVKSGTKPIRLFGRLEEPHLEGDLIVRYADIIMPAERSSTRSRTTAFQYHRKDTTQYDERDIFDFVSTDQSLAPSTDGEHNENEFKTESTSGQIQAVLDALNESAKSDFVDDLEFDLNVYIRGRTILTMEFGWLEILRADLAQTDRKVPLNFTGSFGDNSTELRGTVEVKPGASTYKFYKPFSTSGQLDFGSGGLTNPDLKLIAVYEGRRFIKDQPEDYKVELTINGSKEKPKVSYRVWRKGREVQGDSSKIASDALMLILVGRTQDELFESGQGDLAGQGLTSLSAVATSALSDVVKDIGLIQSAELDLGSDLSTSRITVSGQIFGDVTYRVSGQVSDLSGNSTFTLSMPLSVLADEDALRYLRADFSSTVNNTGNVTRQTRLWEIKFGARLP